WKIQVGSVLLALLVLLGCEADRGQLAPADLVLTNGTIVTIDSLRPQVEALAVRGDTIVDLGPSEEIDAYIGPETQVIDLEGQFARPGFIEGHGHVMSLGQAKMVLDLAQARTWDDIVAMVGTAAAEAEPGAWILGRGWHQEKWDAVPEGAVEGVPTHHSLSA